MVISSFLCLIGVIVRRSSLVYIGTVLSAPFSLHISMTILTSIWKFSGLVIPLTLLGASLSIQFKQYKYAYLL